MAVLQKDIGDLQQQLATRTVSPNEVLPNIRPSEKNEFEKLKAENNTLRQSLSMADAARQRQADEYAELWSRTRPLQSSMDVLQASEARRRLPGMGAKGRGKGIASQPWNVLHG